MPRSATRCAATRSAALKERRHSLYHGGCKVIVTKEDAVEKFVARHQPIVTGVLSGFDRLVFRGTLPLFRQHRGMHIFLGRAEVAWVDWKKFMLATSERLKTAVLAEVERARRPIRYLSSPKTSKEDLARDILAERPLSKPGVVCAFTAVEPCMSFEYHRSKDPKARGLTLRPRKCQHIYKYYVHPTFGFMHARIQTWFPFDVQIYMNGREWLARDLRGHRSGFKQADNCFTWLADPTLAQHLMDMMVAQGHVVEVLGLEAAAHEHELRRLELAPRCRHGLQRPRDALRQAGRRRLRDPRQRQVRRERPLFRREPDGRQLPLDGRLELLQRLELPFDVDPEDARPAAAAERPRRAQRQPEGGHSPDRAGKGAFDGGQRGSRGLPQELQR